MSQTYCAPAERLTPDAVEEQIQFIQQSKLLDTFLNAISGILLVLNEQRQILALNNAFLKTLGIDNPWEALGLRLGESLACVHAREMEGGCGTSQSCASCGAVIAMLATLKTNEPQECICALEFERENVRQNKSLRVRTAPVFLEGKRFILVAIVDITLEQNRATLERIFHHDMNNILSAILGPSEMLEQEMPWRWEMRQIRKAAQRMQQEIILQRELSLEGMSRYIPEKSLISVHDVNQDLDILLHSHNAARDRTIETRFEGQDCLIHTDKMLVSRVLSNMIINALEATDRGGVVQFVTSCVNNQVCWSVWNDSCIPESIRGRIFQRYFSTKKDVGRGLGTFSMKLFGESYLGGKIEFTSSMKDGTVFSFILPIQQLDKDTM